MPHPIPDYPFQHCIVLFPEQKDYVRPFLKRIDQRCSQIDTSQETWTAVAEPRSLLYGPLIWNRWQWHLLFDLHGLAPDVLEIVTSAQMDPATREAVENHKLSAMIFLTGTPDSATSMEQMKAVSRLAWTMLDVGASVVAWPEGRTAWHRDRLLKPDLTC